VAIASRAGEFSIAATRCANVSDDPMFEPMRAIPTRQPLQLLKEKKPV
jgi:hypothetical protein